MSRFDSNPFDEDGGNNPFSDTPAGRGASSGTTASASYFDNAVRPSPLPPESRRSAFDAAVSDLSFSTKDLSKKEKELQARELALKRKEEELARRESELGIKRKNWPPFFPMIRHDIKADIPAYLQSMQTWAYFSWLGCMIALTWNFFAITAAWIDGAEKSTTNTGNFFLALIYMLLGPFLSYFIWYRRLYNSFKSDSAFGFAFFFIGYLIHIVFFTYASVSPPLLFKGKSFAGVLSTIDILSKGGHGVIAIFYAIGAGFFVLETILSVYVLGQIYNYFRGRGKAYQLKQEAAMAAVRAAV